MPGGDEVLFAFSLVLEAVLGALDLLPLVDKATNDFLRTALDAILSLKKREHAAAIRTLWYVVLLMT